MRISAMLVLLLCTLKAPAAVIHVDRHADGRADGSTWTDAYTDLQDALARAQSGDQIWIANGRYSPTDDKDRDATFRVPAGVELYGGFAGVEATLDERNFVRHKTELTGNIGRRGVATDNTARLVEVTEAGPAAVLDGLTLRDCFNDRDGELGRGGAVFVRGASLAVRNCRFERNHSNTGAGVFNEAGRVTIEASDFVNNEGSGVMNWFDGHLVVRSSLFEGNVSELGAGGGVRHYDGVAEVSNCLFVRNTASSRGGGIYGRDDLTVRDCVFIGNHADNYGGGLYQWAGNLRLINSSFYGNSTEFWGGGLSSVPKSSVEGCIFFGNTSGGGEGERAQISADDLNIRYCCVEGWTGRYGGEGNFGDDPLFVDPDGDNVRLRSGSPCIDAGDPDAEFTGLDLDGNPRILAGRIDIGAYENVCGSIRRIHLRRRGKSVVAKVKTRLPDGSTVFIDDGEHVRRAITRGRRHLQKTTAKIAWPHDETPVTACVSGCQNLCETLECP